MLHRGLAPLLTLLLVGCPTEQQEPLPDPDPDPPGVDLTEDLDDSWLGRTAEASGYGRMENGGMGVRKFTAEPIVSLRGDTLTIDGEGRHGVCFGDSGGPGLYEFEAGWQAIGVNSWVAGGGPFAVTIFVQVFP